MIRGVMLQYGLQQRKGSVVNSELFLDDSDYGVILYASVVWYEHRETKKIVSELNYEVTGGWRKLHNEELHNLFSLPDIIRVMKSRRMRWAGNVAGMGN
jgi:hypothetical protein